MKVILEKQNTPHKAGEVLSNILKENGESNILLMLSGGSAFELLDFVEPTFLGKHITISVLDERFSENLDISNFSQLKKTPFYSKASEQKCHFINTETEPGGDLESLKSLFEKEVTEWQKKYKSGLVIVTQGIGEDTHTAGIMPYPKDETLFKSLFENTDNLFVGYDAKEKNKYPLRVTPTNHFLRNNVDHALVYVTGESKREPLSRTLMTKELLHCAPARIIHEMKDVTLVTDVEL